MAKLRPYQVPAEILLVFVTVSAVLAFDRLFADDSFIRPLLITTFLIHIVAAISRRMPGGLATTVLATAAALALQIGVTFYRGTTLLGLPTATTWTSARTDLQDGWQTFQRVIPPAPVEDGFLVAASVGIWLLVVLADWAAFRLRSPGEALLPALGVLVFVTFFGRTVASLRDATLFLAAAVAFFLVHRAGERVSSGTWLGGDRRVAYGTLVLWGSLLGTAALLVGVFGGPRLPGAEEEAIVDLEQTAGDGERARIVVSPLVDIQKRLVEQADQVAFKVRTSQKSYYRLTALDTFNGQAWGSQADYRDANGTIDNLFPIGIPEEQSNLVQQEFEIEALGMVWLPAAHQPQQIDLPDGIQVSYEPASSTLIVDEVLGSSDTLTYTVVSEIPRYTPSDFQTGVRENLDPRYFELPDDFNPRARQLAIEITQGLETPYEKALALQNHFQNPAIYTYSLDTLGGHDGDAIDAFLDSGQGYCEQFAGTFAAMARAVGLPSRVVVGFTYGIQDPTDANLYIVRGEHAHAWPEVYIAGAGWVLFEPTPGRGSPGNEDYTGLAAAQQVSEIPLESDAGAEPTPLQGGGFVEDSLDPSVEELGLGEEDETIDALGADTDSPFDIDRSDRISLLLVAVVSAVVLGIPVLKGLRWKRRTEGASNPRRRIESGWERIKHLAAALGAGSIPGETSTEFAQRVSDSMSLENDDLNELGAVVTEATFASGTPSDEVVANAERLTKRVERALRRRTATKRLVMYDIDPRSLFGGDDNSDQPLDSLDPLLEEERV